MDRAHRTGAGVRRSRRVVTVIVAALAFGAACTPAPSSPSDTTSTTTASTTSTTTTTAAPAPDLRVALEVHVEGWNDLSPGMLDAHLAELEELMDAAEAHGAILSFELGSSFAQALLTYGDTTWDDDVRARGHDVQLHADIGGSGTPPASAMATQLSSQLTTLDFLGIDTQVVTGMCSKGPWLDALASVGITATAGMVEYCLHALDPANDPAEFDRATCTTPAVCHDALGTLLGLHEPWYAADAEDFLAPVAAGTDGAVLLIPGHEGPVCGSEGSSGTSCVWDADDGAGYAAKLADAIAGRSSATSSVFTSAWSVGTPVDPTTAEDVFARIEAVMADGGAHWERISDIAAAGA